MKKTKYIYGYHSVITMLLHNSKYVSCVYLQSKKNEHHIQELINLVQKNNIPLKYLLRENLNHITQCSNHQGIVAEIFQEKEYTEKDLKTILKKTNATPLILILDGIQDPHNLGACLRTANAARVDAVIAPKNKACGLTSTVYKTASGAAQITPFVQVTNLASTIRILKEIGIWIVGTCEDAKQDIYHLDFKIPLALVFGSEGDGLRHLTQKNCDFIAKIPMLGTVTSLNISVAVGVCLFETIRQRKNF